MRSTNDTDLAAVRRGHAERVKHLIVSASYRGDHHVTGVDVTEALKGALIRDGVEPIAAMAYTTYQFIHPYTGSLLDVWTNMSDRQRARLAELFPQLHMAVFLAIKGTVPDPVPCSVVSPKGTACTVEGPHDVHLGPMAEKVGLVTVDEVWRDEHQTP